MTYVIQVRPLLLFVDGDLFYSEFGVEQVTIHKQEQRPHLNHNSYLLVTVRVTTEKQKTVGHTQSHKVHFSVFKKGSFNLITLIGWLAVQMK